MLHLPWLILGWQGRNSRGGLVAARSPDLSGLGGDEVTRVWTAIVWVYAIIASIIEMSWFAWRSEDQ
jgi:hypothetical protein